MKPNDNFLCRFNHENIEPPTRKHLHDPQLSHVHATGIGTRDRILGSSRQLHRRKHTLRHCLCHRRREFRLSQNVSPKGERVQFQNETDRLYSSHP